MKPSMKILKAVMARYANPSIKPPITLMDAPNIIISPVLQEPDTPPVGREAVGALPIPQDASALLPGVPELPTGEEEGADFEEQLFS